MQTSPEMFPYEEIPVTENKVSMDLFFPGAAFLVVSCKAEPKATKREWVSDQPLDDSTLVMYRSHNLFLW